jgi:hypothetical protein
VTELNIYFHSLGQLLKTSNANRISTTNRENVFPSGIFENDNLNDWEISLNMEYIDFSATHGSECVQAQMMYDQCIISQFLELHNNSRFAHLFLKEGQRPLNWEGVPAQVIEDYYATMMSQDAVSRCPKSCTSLKVQYTQKPRRKFV